MQIKSYHQICSLWQCKSVEHNTTEQKKWKLIVSHFQNSHFASTRSRHSRSGGKHFSLGSKVQRERPGFGAGGSSSTSSSATIVDPTNPFDYDGPSSKKVNLVMASIIKLNHYLIFFFKTTATTGPMSDWRGGSTASSEASGTNRVAAMKAAFQSQFKSSFVRSIKQNEQRRTAVNTRMHYLLFFRLQPLTLV